MWTNRSVATPPEYSHQQRQRKNTSGLKGILGAGPRNRSQSMVRGEASGYRIYPGAFGVIAMVRHPDHVYLAQRARLHDLSRLGGDTGCFGAAAHHQDQAALFRGAHDFPALLDAPGQRFFDEDVLLCRQRIQRHAVVPVVGRSNGNGVDVPPGENRMIIPHGFDSRGDLFRARQVSAINIASYDRLDSCYRLE